jgi:filamentous hemagglutinin family protein
MTRATRRQTAIRPAPGIGTLRRDRAALLRATALQAAFLAVFVVPAAAQPAPGARPTGGVVTGGNISINQSSPTNTQITQTTPRGAVDWRSFDIGSQQSVTFAQPGASAVTLNRVTAANPSQIAGRIDANGQIVIVNQSGVVFFPGSQVNAQSVVVSAAGIDPKAFMAGSLAFDQAPRPGAKIVNAGTLTAGRAGLVGLVAPQVANSGVITAKMGHVVLAGAEAHTLDMYGDGLISLDVTRQVTYAPVGQNGQKVAALVTNTGLIRADGGTVQLTAAAADGLVQTLVNAGGTISTRSTRNSVGSINIAGTGGSVIVDGALLANGHGAGQTGGNIAVNATGDVTLAPSARIAANGRAGGGTIALGTTLARAAGGSSVLGQPTARTTTVEAGARVSANTTQSGNGGTVTVLSSGVTAMRGAIAAKGGAHGGDGGAVEISGNHVRLGGSVDVTAAAGATGVILLDPEDLTISTIAAGATITPGAGDPSIPYTQGGFASGDDYYVTPAQLAALSGNVHLQAARFLTVASSFTNNSGGITLEAGSNLTVNAGATLATTGLISLSAGVNFGTVAGYDPGATLSVLGGLSASTIQLSAPTGGVVFGTGAVNATNNFQINTTGAISEPATGAVGGVFNTFSAASINLPGLNNFGTLFGATATSGNVLITNAPGNTISISGRVSVPSGNTIALTADQIAIQSSISAPLGTVIFSPSTADYGAEIINSGTNGAAPGTNVLSLNYNALTAFITAQTIDLGSSQRLIGPIKIGNPAQNGNIADTIDLTAIASGGEGTFPSSLGVFSTTSANVNGLLYVGELHGQVGSLDAGFLLNGSQIATVGPLTANTDILIRSFVATTVAGPVIGNRNVEIETSGTPLTLTGNVTGQFVLLNADFLGGSVTQTGGIITAGSLNVLAGDTFAGSISLTGNNQITSLTQFFEATSGIAYLNNARPLTVSDTTFGQSTTLNVAGGITFTGLGTGTSFHGPSFVSLVSTGAVSQTGTGALSVNTLSVSGTTVGLSSTTNKIDAISAGTASVGGFAITDANSLLVAGTITAATGSTIAITADTVNISIAGGTLAGALIVPTGTIALAPLTSGTPYNLYAVGPVPTGVSGFSVGGEGSLITASVLQLGSPTTGAITIAPDGNAVTFSGTNGINQLALISGSSITQGASLTVPTLSGNANSVTLNASNTIATLASFTTVNGFTLTDGSALAVTGPVNGGTGLLLSAGGTLTLGGNASTTGTASLTGTSGIAQTAGTLSAATLSVASSGGAVSLTAPGNQIGTLGASNSLAGLILNDSTSLTVGGFVNSPTISLSVTGPLTVGAELYAPGGPVTLTSTAAITEIAGGGISAGTLQGSGTSAALTQTGNVVTTLGSFATTSGFALTSQSFTVTGPLTDSTSIVLTSNGSLTVAGNITAPAVALNANTLVQFGDIGSIVVPGNIYQTAGTVGATTLSMVAEGLIDETGGGGIVAGTLTGSATGSVNELGTANFLGTLGGFSSAGGFALVNNQALAVTGPVTDTVGIVLSTRPGGVALSGVLNAPTIALNSAGAISQGGGSLVANVLEGSGASVVLGSVTNAIDTLGPFASNGNFLLADASALTVIHSVSTTRGGTLTLLDNSPTIAASGTLIANAGTVVLAPLTAGTPFTLGGGSGLAGTSQITANELVVGSATAGSITIAGAFNLTAVATLDLISAAAITENGGAGIAVNTLTGAGASLTLNQVNTIGTLAAINTPGILTLTDTTPLAVIGPVSATGGVSLSINGALTLAGPVTTAGTADFASTAAITQTGGSLDAATLTNSASSTSLTAVTNAIGTLSTSTDTTSFTLVDNTGLIVTGVVDPATVNLTINGPLTIAAPIYASDNAALFVTGAITEAPGGFISTPLLRGSAASAAFSQGSDDVFTLGSFTTASGFTLINQTGMTITGPVVDGVSIAVTSRGSLQIAGTVSAPSVSLTATNNAIEGTIYAPGYIEQTDGSISGTRSVSLIADSYISQTGGNLLAGTLTGSAGGTVSLPSTTNLVGTLGGFNSAGGFELINSQGLAVDGPVIDTTSIALTTTGGGLAFFGAANAPTITLNATAMITQAGGSLVATLLTGSGAGVTLGSATNAVGTLGAFASSGNFTFADAAPVTVSGVVSAGTGGTLALANDNPSFAANAALIAAGGTVILAPLTGGDPITLGGGGGLAGTSQVTANTLVVGNPTAGAITIAGAFNLANVPTLDLVSGGNITESSGGAIAVNTLLASGMGITLTGANQIGILGNVTATALTLNDAQSLTVTGPVVGSQSVSLTAAGSLTVVGNIAAPLVGLTTTGSTSPTAQLAAVNISVGGSDINLSGGTITAIGTTAAGTLSLNSAGGIQENAGLFTTNQLTGSAVAGVSLLNPLNTFGALGPFSSQTGFVLAGAANHSFGRLAATVSGPVTDATSIILIIGGGLTLAGNVSAPIVNFQVGDQLGQTAGGITATTLNAAIGFETSLTSSANSIANLGQVSDNDPFALVDGRALTISSQIVAPSINIAASGGINLNGGSFTSSQTALQVLASSAGIVPTLNQTGTTSFIPTAGATSGTLLLAVPDGGSITLANLSAPSFAVTLNTGVGGTSAGNLVANALLVNGSGGSANLFGTVGGNTGFAAAIASKITPAFSTSYLLNNCPIMSVTCTTAITNPGTTTIDIPVVAGTIFEKYTDTFLRPDLITLDLLTLAVAPDPNDPEELLPNISRRDN